MSKKYENYKNSCSEWLGEIPKHWNFAQIKRITQVKRGASPRPIDDEKYFDDEGEYAWVRISDVTASNKFLERTEQSLSDLGASLSVKMNPGDLFLSIAGSVGKPIITKIKCCIHDGFVWFENLELDKEFLYYIFLSGEAFKGLGKLGTQLNLNTETVGSITIPLPPESEVRSIVNYLNYKTGQIDLLIAQKEQLMNLLQKKRQAIIYEAVTQGLNPNAPRQDSGIEWLGKIPAHWEASRLKYIVSCNQESLPESTNPEYRFKYIDISSVSLARGVEKMEEMLFEEAPSRARRKVKEGDIIISTVRTYLKAIAYLEEVDEDVIVSTGFAVLTPNDNRYNKYISYFVKSEAFVNAVVANSVGVSYPAINSSELMNLEIVLPPYDEVRAITDLLDKKTAHLHQTEAALKNQIEGLKSYRQSIINEVVTGKVDVREVVLNEV